MRTPSALPTLARALALLSLTGLAVGWTLGGRRP